CGAAIDQVAREPERVARRVEADALDETFERPPAALDVANSRRGHRAEPTTRAIMAADGRLPMRLRRLLLAPIAVLATSVLAAVPPVRDDVPEALRPWETWVLHGHEDETCPHLGSTEDAQC